MVSGVVKGILVVVVLFGIWALYNNTLGCTPKGLIIPAQDFGIGKRVLVPANPSANNTTAVGLPPNNNTLDLLVSEPNNQIAPWIDSGLVTQGIAPDPGCAQDSNKCKGYQSGVLTGYVKG